MSQAKEKINILVRLSVKNNFYSKCHEISQSVSYFYKQITSTILGSLRSPCSAFKDQHLQLFTNFNICGNKILPVDYSGTMKFL